MKQYLIKNRSNILFYGSMVIIISGFLVFMVYTLTQPEPEPEPLVILDEFNVENIQFSETDGLLPAKKMTVETDTIVIAAYLNETRIVQDGDTGNVRLVEYETDEYNEARYRLFVPKDKLKEISRQYTDAYGTTIPIKDTERDD